MKNPFYFGNEVHDDGFCNRVSELANLKNDVKNGLNILLYAPRRFGKTSLLKKLQEELKGDTDTKVMGFRTICNSFCMSKIDIRVPLKTMLRRFCPTG